jgi:hypothetical protein
VGTSGPGWEQPLEAGVKMPLKDRMDDGANKGFLRDDALLAVVILTDEDDCSTAASNVNISVSPGGTPGGGSDCTEPVDKYITFLDQLKGNHGRWAAAVVAGPSACMSSFGSAIEAVRLKDFVSKVGQNAIFSSICDGDLTAALTDALNTFTAACDNFQPIG